MEAMRFQTIWNYYQCLQHDQKGHQGQREKKKEEKILKRKKKRKDNTKENRKQKIENLMLMTDILLVFLQ